MRVGPVSQFRLMSIVCGAALTLTAGPAHAAQSAQITPCPHTDQVEFEKMTWVEVKCAIALGAAKSAARDVAVELLGVLKAAVGDLDHVSQVARMLVMVNGAPGFNEPHRIADGASELLVEVFGERGLHARSALVAADLPFGAALEIDLVVEVAVEG